MPNTIILPLQFFHPRLTEKECRNPRLVIKSIFAERDMPEDRALLERWVFCTFSVQRRLSDQQRLLIPTLNVNLLRLLDAASLLAKEEGPNRNNHPSASEVHNPEWFFKRKNAAQIPVCYFPRHLDLEEMINPYVVFGTTCEYMTIKGWESLLNLMRRAGNSRDCICEATGYKRLYRDCDLLPKLLEAAYLVYVREIDEPAVAPPIH